MNLFPWILIQSLCLTTLSSRGNTYLMESIGGTAELTELLHHVAEHASNWRGGMSASVVHTQKNGETVVAKVCFEDNICWAAKITRNEYGASVSMMAAQWALLLLEEHCPHIPSPRLRGLGESYAFLYYFVDWIEGKTLRNQLQYRPYPFPPTRLPAVVITSLAEFVYNLTTCAIPEKECKYIHDKIDCSVVSKTDFHL